jgi:hypothetical protein
MSEQPRPQRLLKERLAGDHIVHRALQVHCSTTLKESTRSRLSFQATGAAINAASA